MAKPIPLLAICISLAALPAQATETGLRPLPYADLAAAMGGRIGFDSLPPRPEPGLSLDHPFPVEGAWVGAGFAGQGEAVRHLRSGARFDDVAGDGQASAPLRLVGHGTGQGVALAWHRGFGSTAAFPLGPDGFTQASGRGEGALAVLFARDQWGVGLRVHSDYPDPLGQRPDPPGALRLIVLARDGRVLADLRAPLGVGITELAWARQPASADIAGVLLLNDDPGGIAVDDIVLVRAPAVARATPPLDPPPPAPQDAGQTRIGTKGTPTWPRAIGSRMSMWTTRKSTRTTNG